MTTQEILYSVSGRVATITLNRPDKLNAWTRTMEQEARQAMHHAAADDLVRVIALTGAGRGFCPGADMSLLQDVMARRVHALPNARPSRGPPAWDARRAGFGRPYPHLPARPTPVIPAANP